MDFRSGEGIPSFGGENTFKQQNRLGGHVQEKKEKDVEKPVNQGKKHKSAKVTPQPKSKKPALDVHSESDYSEMLHPNADPSVFSQLGGAS